MPTPDKTWLDHNPWRTTIARLTTAELAPQYRDRTISPTDERRLIDEVGVIAVADDLDRRHVWLRDVEGDARAALTHAAELAVAVAAAEAIVADAARTLTDLASTVARNAAQDERTR